MMDLCRAAPAGAGFVRSVDTYLDCQAQILGSAPWTALHAPGSAFSFVLTGFLTLFVALIGYRLLLGGNLTVRSGTLALVKVGAVLALATSWPAYRALAYDLVVDGPSELMGEIGRPAGVPGSDGSLLERLDLADRALSELVILGPGAAPANVQSTPPPFSGFDEFALGGSRIIFLLTAVASLSAVHLIAGLMLALGPLFIAFLMFDATRGFFEAWLRVLAGSALAALGVSLALGLELAFIQPWLSALIAIRTAGGGLPAVPSEILVVIILFAIITFALLKASARAASGFRLDSVIRIAAQAARPAPRDSAGNAASGSKEPEDSPGPSRAASVARAVVAMSRRESAVERRRAEARLGRPSFTERGAGSNGSFVPAGRSFTHSARRRSSARATRRDLGR